ncbi:MULTISPECIES: hypothetical protein [Burkholderia cepacia complex]|uniref:hypothetical protein n=1 Tax=Burkholderia cepacia complex TaxID=87882 RepID=UPI0013DDB342|nr:MULTISPECIES: hypothetical protein [Burkholderia cepacia complex]
MKKTVLALLLAATAPCHAVELGKALYCNLSVRNFFAPLVQRHLISARPVTVYDSINSFRPTPFSHLTAFRMNVTAVYGYTNDPLLFERGPGTPPPDEYGVVVREDIANVQAVLNSAGATSARTLFLGRGLTEISCSGQ